MEYLTQVIEVYYSIISQLLILFGWVSAVIVSAISVKRGTSFKLFLCGSILMFIGSFVLTYISQKGPSMNLDIFTLKLTIVVISLLQLVGIVLIIIGFWKSAIRRV